MRPTHWLGEARGCKAGQKSRTQAAFRGWPPAHPAL